MNRLLEGLPESTRRKLVKMEQPEWEEPMLAMLTNRRFDDHGWIFGRKLDGERCIAYKKYGKVRLMSRNRHVLNASYPEVADALEKTRTTTSIRSGHMPGGYRPGWRKTSQTGSR